MRRNSHRTPNGLLKVTLAALAARLCVVRPLAVVSVMLLTVAILQGQTEGQVSGTIVLNGCQALASNLEIRASEIAAEFPARNAADEPDVTADTRPAALSSVTGSVVPTRDPRVFQFTFRGLAPQGIYRLAVRLTGARCGRVYFETPKRGLVHSGQPDPVAIAGYAVRSQLEVLRGTSGRVQEWVPADHLDIADPAQALRRIRFRSDLPGVNGAILQVATRRFPLPRDGRSFTGCELPASGIVHSERIAARAGAWTEFTPVDFRAVLTVRPGIAAPSPAATAAAQSALQKILLGAPVYVRAIPTVSGRPVCDIRENGLAPWIVLAKLPKPPKKEAPQPDPDVKKAAVEYRSVQIVSKPGDHQFCVEAIKSYKLPYAGYSKFNPLGIPAGATTYDVVLVWKGKYDWGDTVPAGEWWCLSTKSDSSWFDTFVDIVTAPFSAVIDAVGFLVNKVSAAWEEIQDAVVDAVAGVVDSLDIIDCGPGSLCRSALETGLEVGLAAMGVPPSLPNWDQLVSEGMDYLAAEIASQTGVPQPLVEKSLEAAQKVVAEMKSNHKVNGLPSHLAPFLGVRPASIVWTVSQNSPGELAADERLLKLEGNDVFRSKLIPLPKELPVWPKTLNIPVVLEPNLDGIAPLPKIVLLDGTEFQYSDYDVALHYKTEWAHQKYGYKDGKVKTPVCLEFEGFRHRFSIDPLPGGGFNIVDKSTKSLFRLAVPNDQKWGSTYTWSLGLYQFQYSYCTF